MPSGRNFGSVRVGERARARPRRCRRRRATSSAAGRAAGGRAARRAMRSRSQPASANTRPCSGPSTRMASKPSTQLRVVHACAGTRRATAARLSGVARQLVDDAARALAGEHRDARRRPASTPRLLGERRRTASRRRPRRSRTTSLPGLPCVARSTSPGRPPPTLRTTSCRARPIVRLARLPWPSALTPAFIPIAARARPAARRSPGRPASSWPARRGC